MRQWIERLKKGIGSEYGWRVAVGGIILVLLVACPAIFQGLNWDEPWMLNQARVLASRGCTESYKPLAGILAWPAWVWEEAWLPLRINWLVFQAGLMVLLLKSMPSDWSHSRKLLLLLLLWMEPTFRERVLEVRTDTPIVCLLVGATLFWSRRTPWAVPFAGVSIGVALALSPRAIIWVVPWALVALILECSVITLKRVGVVLLVALGSFFLCWSIVAAWTQRDLWTLLREATKMGGVAVQGSKGLLSANSFFYFKQSLRIGWPFYGMAAWGVFRRIQGLRGEGLGRTPFEHLGWVGLGALSLAPFYDGAFPYHYIGIAPFLIPFVAIASEDILRVGGRFAAILTLSTFGITLVVASIPILRGPALMDQISVVRAARAYLQPGLGYVDGVGALPGPQAAPFVTSKVVALPENRDLSDRWNRGRVSVVVMNGRSEQLMSQPNLRWIQQRMVMVHPNLAVLGTGGTCEGAGFFREWEVPWMANFQFHGSGEWHWKLNGRSIEPGTVLSLPRGRVLVEGKGKGSGAFALTLLPSGLSPGTPKVLPFFLPFQRE